MSTTKRKAATGKVAAKAEKQPEKKSGAKTPRAKEKVAEVAPKATKTRKAAVEVAPPPAPPAPTKKSAKPKKPTLKGLLEIGRETLGIKDFRPGQAEAFEQILEGKDVLAVMPTGSGKSLLYQLPSLVLPGMTVVVSPLIALIKDQVDKMRAKGVAVVRIDSTLTVRQRREMDALALAPGGKLLLTTPERMADPEFREFLRDAAEGVGVSRFVVDEAHCVSQWGHDFRPAYLSLRKALEDVGRPPVLATTATAPPHVREDVLFQLGMKDASVITTTFDRPNLHYEVIVFHDEDEKMKTLVTLLKKLPRPGIVYCATVKKVEELYESLGRHGIPVAKYHGRMGKNDRDSEQERFMESADVVMLATNAFGLGVDKKNIRNVLHYHVPGSLESYAQEAGRGGRDGKPTRCVLLFSPDDVAIQEYFLSGTYPTKRQVKAVYAALEAFEDEGTKPVVADIALAAGVGQQRTRTVLSLLKDEHIVLEHEGGMYELAEEQPDPEELDYKAKQYEARRIADRQRLDALLAYVKAPGCRNVVILDYLGEKLSPSCGRCDNCLRSKDAAMAAAKEASQLGLSVTRQLDEEGGGAELASKPRRIVRTRLVRIDRPDPNAPAGVPAPVTAAGSGPILRAPDGARAAPAGADKPAVALPGAAAAPGPVRRRAGEEPQGARTGVKKNGATRAAEPVVDAKPAAAPPVVRRAAAAAAPAPVARKADAKIPAQTALPLDAKAPAAEPAGKKKVPTSPGSPDGSRMPAPEELEDDEDLDDDEDDDEELEEGEEAYADDEDDDDLDDDEDDDEDEDDDDLDDEEGELDDDDLDDEDDDLDDDEDDDDLDDDEDDDLEEYEVIDKTAAELAEEGATGEGEITVLARKRVPKPPKQRGPKLTPTEKSAASEARRRRRRRRRKRRGLLPPKSAFTTPVLSTAAPMPDAGPRLRGPSGPSGGGGPVIEYVRGPLRINSAPVATATPNDVAARKGKRRRGGPDRPRFDRGGGGGGGAGYGAPGGGGGPDRRLTPQERREQRLAERLEKKRRRRRRRRKRGAGLGVPGSPDAPVSFFSPAPGGGGGGPPQGFRPSSNGNSAGGGPNGGMRPPGPSTDNSNGDNGPVMLGPDGQPLPRKRRRRRRRGRRGRALRNADGTWKVPPGPEGAGFAPEGGPPQLGGGTPPALPPPTPERSGSDDA